MSGSVEEASIEYIIRDHDRARFEARKHFMESAVALLNERHGEGVVELTLKDQYYNMKEMVEPYPELIEKAQQAMKLAGVTPIVRPIRVGRTGLDSPIWDCPVPTCSPAG